ncbi:MAG: hypothetical protein GX654_07645 [Desulfatiglans sp.]|nr:hypothetical protein [Desulfatiglans sp.]
MECNFVDFQIPVGADPRVCPSEAVITAISGWEHKFFRADTQVRPY